MRIASRRMRRKLRGQLHRPTRTTAFLRGAARADCVWTYFYPSVMCGNRAVCLRVAGPEVGEWPDGNGDGVRPGRSGLLVVVWTAAATVERRVWRDALAPAQRREHCVEYVSNSVHAMPEGARCRAECSSSATGVGSVIPGRLCIQPRSTVPLRDVARAASDNTQKASHRPDGCLVSVSKSTRAGSLRHAPGRVSQCGAAWPVNHAV